MNEHGLRELARAIEQVAQAHPYYGQADVIVKNCVDHLTLLASYYENHAKEQK